MKKQFLLLAWMLGAFYMVAQNPYTTKQYNVRVEKDLVYGAMPNYAGISTTLLLDLYKPIGDNNPSRPLLVLVHGGSWLGGCKEAMVTIATEMAQRGYVVASVNYRLGWHKSAGPIGNPVTDAQAGATLYAADSMELIRAIYRGQQDVKGAIRWLKGRAAVDSICTERVLVGGESAGGFLSMAVGFLDRPEEKPVSCNALAPAPVPAANLTNSYSLNCTTQIIQPSGTALNRPDLGPVDGTLNLNGYDANVIGVVNLFGGVPYEGASNNWLQGPDTPAVYLYHQTCDGVVPFGLGTPFFVISNYCNLGFTPWHTNYMKTYGSGAISVAFAGAQMQYTTDFDQCPDFNPALAFFECLRYGDNGSYHYTANPVLRSQKIADYFSPFVTGSPCYTVATKEPARMLQAVVSPNPFEDQLSVTLEQAPEGEAQVWLSDLSGKMVWQTTTQLHLGTNTWQGLQQLPAGMYALHLRTSTGAGVWKVVKKARG
jgi:dienelactone hydrolase